jgi:hypothetical protein
LAGSNWIAAITTSTPITPIETPLAMKPTCPVRSTAWRVFGSDGMFMSSSNFFFQPE